MRSQEARVAVLENRMDRVDARLESIDESLHDIVTTLAQMSGGKKAVLGLFTLIGMGIGAIASFVTFVKFWKGV